MKEALKRPKSKQCIKCGKSLPKEMSKYDTHRKTLRMDGGIYNQKNYDLICATCHMKEHDTFKNREENLDQLKSLFDGYKQIQKTRLKVNNQILASKRHTDTLDEIDMAFLDNILKEILDKEKAKEKQIKIWVKENKNIPIISSMLSVNGVGEIFITACLTYIDIHKARHASSLWRYFGYHTPCHKRKEKLETPIEYINHEGKNKKRWYSPGNQTLRCQAYVTAGCFLKGKNNLYKEIYYNRKAKTEISEKITSTRLTGKKGLHAMMWKDVKKIHRHEDALRVMMKFYIADLWYVWRSLEGLSVNDLYVKEHLGHESGIINPKKRGWKY